MHRPVAGHHQPKAPLGVPLPQLIQAGQPGAGIGMGRGGHAIGKHQAAGKQHAGVLVQQHQVVTRVALQALQVQHMAPQAQGLRRQRLTRRCGLGGAHPIATQAVEVIGIGLALGALTLNAAGQRLDGDIGPGLVAKEVVGVQVQVQHLAHGLVCHGGDGAALLLAVQARGAGIDHQHALAGGDEGGVDDVAAVGTREIGHRALDDPGVLGNAARLQAVVQTGHVGLGRGGRRRGRLRAGGHGAGGQQQGGGLHARTSAAMRLPLLSCPLR